jgi:hypothetical protein
MEVIRSYKSSTLGVFKEPIQDAVTLVNQKAIKAGFDLDKHNLRYAIAEVNDEWVVVLLVFKPNIKLPDEFVVSIPKNG